MKKLQNARKTLRKNNKKGFTLIELIVVIVILAILMAALAPAVLGAIERANVSADQADLRSMIMAASLASLETTPAAVPPKTAAGITAINSQLTGGGNMTNGKYTVNFDGVMAVGGTIADGRSSGATIPTNVTPTYTLVITFSGGSVTALE